ncbi:MAG: hypothetical protein B7X69_00505 [Sulfurovum sp. 39-42-12]|jgi:uncharacterized membrane protein|nr:MAG: hypothetical protein B7Y63_08895 [Sulfurovum sp. 35-42-20]OYZ23672.1 MAG: hypothetical protein B7Y23_09970 [Sulfurovum sp. 16-42-52]OYZ47975.1 MAG: hypothetical protein B7Y13_09010 [Sulfurovum sp. 24-42-9]OZA43390.1 MAG: hypothetical protein B7X80_09350 [Sulfurovum sp. 17-42-90]OZA61414.1 MAG: hypothetical protein B7X69_00505 [Sulfurovum sp. 39-42-12]HQS78515.1 hypothetical protein [Sulfurovum sp.]
MKKLVLASILALGLSSGLVYANQAAKGVAGDMSAMKAAGKCNADQSVKVKTKAKAKKHTLSKAELELENANKLATGDDSVTGDMGNMKVQGKCGTGHMMKAQGKCGSD